MPLFFILLIRLFSAFFASIYVNVSTFEYITFVVNSFSTFDTFAESVKFNCYHVVSLLWEGPKPLGLILQLFFENLESI